MKPVTYVLQVIFDIRQASDRLNWQYFVDGADGRHDKNKKNKSEANLTGTYAFKKGDLLKLEVVARGIDPAHETKISILDCHVISRPILHFASDLNVKLKLAGTYPEPSPFSDTCVNRFNVKKFKNWEERASQLIDGKTVEFFTISTSLLEHVNTGRWQTSFMMTVEIDLKGVPQPRRVFTFDPECQVGTGVENP